MGKWENGKMGKWENGKMRNSETGEIGTRHHAPCIWHLEQTNIWTNEVRTLWHMEPVARKLEPGTRHYEHGTRHMEPSIRKLVPIAIGTGTNEHLNKRSKNPLAPGTWLAPGNWNLAPRTEYRSQKFQQYFWLSPVGAKVWWFQQYSWLSPAGATLRLQFQQYFWISPVGAKVW